MSLSNGRTYLAIPGPSVMPDEVLRAMHRAAPNIYSGDLIEMTASLIPDLRAVARTKGEACIYIANGHGTWEAALANVLNEGDHALCLVTGRFGHGWADMAEGMGIIPHKLDFGKKDPIDLNRFADALRADKEHRLRAVLLTHVDTATSRKNDVAAVRRVMDDLGHPAVLMVDCIASLGCDRYEMDAWGADVTIAACQKGLMVPPGLGFVFLNDRAKEARKSVRRVSRYWDWMPRYQPQFYYQYFDGTAPTHHLFGLRAALDMIHAEGIENVWARHDTLARAIWAACDVWGQGGDLRLNIGNADHRSRAVTAAGMKSPDATRLRNWLEQNTGVTLGIGLGMAEPDDPAYDGFFRFGHMGHINPHMVLGMLASVEAGMTALNIAHGSGAVEAAAKVIAAGA